MKAAGLPWPFHVARAVPVGTPSGAGARSALPACAAALSSAAARAPYCQVQRIVTLGYARLRKELEQSRQPAPSMAAALGISTSTSPQARAAAPRSPLQKTSTS